MPRTQPSTGTSGSPFNGFPGGTHTLPSRRSSQYELQRPRKRSKRASDAGRLQDGRTGAAHAVPQSERISRGEMSRAAHEVAAENIPSSIEPTSEIIMAIDSREKSAMGCSFFDTENGTLLIGTDVPMADLDTAEQILAQIQPTTVLINGRAPEDLITFMENRSALTLEDGSRRNGFVLRALSSSDFVLRKAHDGLLALQNPGHQDLDDLEADSTTAHISHEPRRMNLIRCGTAVDFASQVSVSCAGAVLGELNRRRLTEFLPEGLEVGDLFQVTALETFSLIDSVFVTQETTLALQIIQSEQHPNSQISGGVESASGSKESLSVYGLFHHLAGTPQGRASLRRLFLRPTQNLNVITERHDFIALFVNPENSDNTKQAAKALRRVGNARRVISQLRKGAESPSTRQSDSRGAWSSLKRFVSSVLHLREAIAAIQGYQDIELLSKIVDSIEPAQLMSVGAMIEKTIDFEDSKDRQRLCVRPGVDRQLDEQRRLYDGMSDLLTQVVDRMRVNIPEWAQRYVRSCIFFPQLGFLTAVDADPQTGNGRYEGEGGGQDQWEKMFASDGVVCYKNGFMRQLDEEYGDMYCEIGDREVEILHDLSCRVLEHEEALIVASDFCGQVDALLALAIGAQKYNWSRPEMTDKGGISIKEGRHPLQELAVPCFIPNDCHLPDTTGAHGANKEISPALLLTGPNHSGKSVYLKQTAIIIYLAQVGSYVPAESAVLGLTDKIFTRLSTRESVSHMESAFAIELTQVAQAMKGATPRSLILVDEFGKGTSPDDGAGMLAALIDHFLAAGQDCPKLMIATHFHEIFEGGYLNHRPNLRVAHLEVEIDGNNQQAEDHLTYLFKLAQGHSSSSFGCRCAALNGVPSAVVRRAEAVSSMIARHEDLVTACSQLSSREEAHLERAEAVARHFLATDPDTLIQRSPAETGERHRKGSMMRLLDGVLGSDSAESD